MDARVEVTQILRAIERGEAEAADRLIPLVYEELRRLATAMLAQERAGQTLQPTALVHEAYLRLVSGNEPPTWANRRHFFAAAAEAMRRILVENARRKARLKHGGRFTRRSLSDVVPASSSRPTGISSPADLLAINEALEELERVDSQSAELVKLRFFAGLTSVEAAELLEVSPRTADRLWAYAKSWLYRALNPES